STGIAALYQRSGCAVLEILAASRKGANPRPTELRESAYWEGVMPACSRKSLIRCDWSKGDRRPVRMRRSMRMVQHAAKPLHPLKCFRLHPEKAFTQFDHRTMRHPPAIGDHRHGPRVREIEGHPMREPGVSGDTGSFVDRLLDDVEPLVAVTTGQLLAQSVHRRRAPQIFEIDQGTGQLTRWNAQHILHDTRSQPYADDVAIDDLFLHQQRF